MGLFSNAKKYIKDEFLFYNDFFKDMILKKIDNRYINFSRSLEVFGTNKELKCVYLGEEMTNPLWGIEISKEGTDTVYLNNIESIIRNHAYKQESKMILFYSKRPILDSSFYKKESIYLFSYNRKLLGDIAHDMDIDFMDTDKIFQAFYDIGLINDYEINHHSLALKSKFNFTSLPKDEFNNLYFKTIFAEGVYGGIVKDENPKDRNYNLYQGISIDGDYLPNSPDLYKLFEEDWNGYVAFNLDFYDKEIEQTLSDTNAIVQFGEKKKEISSEYGKALDEVGSLVPLSCVVNIVALLDNKEAVNRLSSILNIQFIPKNIGVKNIVYSTPILEKASAYDFIIPIKNIGSWIKSIHKKHNIVSRTAKHMVGRDVSHNFINYSWSETGDSLHWAIVAPTRSGKTFTIINTIKTILGTVIVPKTEAEIINNKKRTEEHGDIMLTEKIISAPNLGKAKIVHFDTGNSAFAYVSALKEYKPSQVFISNDDVNLLRFGLMNIGYDEDKKLINDTDFLFSVAIFNLILTLNNSQEIDGAELSELRMAMTRIFMKDDYRGLTLKEMEKIGGYEDTIDDIIEYCSEKGVEVSKNDRTTDLNLRRTALDYVQKPTMSTLLKEIERKSDNYGVSVDEKEACLRLHTKMKIIESQNMFAYYDKNNIQECDYYYTELQSLKELGERFFLPAYMITLRRLYRRDVARATRLKILGKPVPAVHYIMEEVHNFIGIGVLKKYFNVITREASRYQIYFGFVTQMPRDIPEEILGNIGSRMILSSNKVTKSDLSYYWANDTDNKEEVSRLVDFYTKRRKKYMTFINSGNGIVTVQSDISPSEERLFNSNGEADLAEEIEDVA